MGRDAVAECPTQEQIVFHFVATRSEIAVNGFPSVYDQQWTATQITLLVDSLNPLGELDLADAFHRRFWLLQDDGFDKHLDWNHVSNAIESEIDAIGGVAGDPLWALDGTLAAFLD